MLDLSFLRFYQLDLQLFASAEDEGRTQEPSERRRREKREEGQVGKSPELVSSAVFLVTFWTICLLFQSMIANTLVFIKYYVNHLNTSLIEDHYKQGVMLNIFFFKVVGPLLIVAFLTAILVNIFQVGFLITPKALAPKMERISFTFKKMKDKIFFSRPVLFNLLFSTLRLILLSGAFILLIQAHLNTLLSLTNIGLRDGVHEILMLLVKIFSFGGIFLVTIGVFDFLNKRKQFEDSLKITPSESKRESKQEEGNPQVKNFLREMYNQILQKQSVKTRIPTADVVITNPTHFAVALKYSMDSMDSPMVIAKGEDDMALLMRKIATDSDVRIVENPPLARELYKIVKVGDYIPEHLSLIIAEIFIQLYQDGLWSMNQEIIDEAS